MNEVIEKIITDIEIHKGRKYCANIHQTLRDDGYAPSICNFVRSVRPEKVTKLIAYIRQLEKQVAEGEQLKQRLDAVVAENVKLIEDMRAIYTDGFLLTTATGSGDDIYLWDYICDPKQQIEQWIAEAKTTSAALAEVEAKAIEKAAKELFGCGYSFELLMRYTTPPAPAVPDGYMLVPVELLSTASMLIDLCRTHTTLNGGGTYNQRVLSDCETTMNAIASLLAAVPTPSK